VKNFVWFFGKIEDVDDPLQLGRVRVRPFNLYTEEQGRVATENLPWAVAINSITNPGHNNVGTSSVGFKVDTVVFGMFADGDDMQTPVVLGSLSGAKIDGEEEEKFHDLPWLARPDARIRSDDPLIAAHKRIKEDQRDLNVRAKGAKWSEPEDPYNAKYPLNRVERTHSGHIFEVDDTEGAERIHQMHKSGTFEEIHPDGTVVRRIVGENYQIVASSDNVHIKGDCNLTIDGSCNLHIKKNWNIQVDGNVDWDVRGNIDIDATRIDLN